MFEVLFRFFWLAHLLIVTSKVEYRRKMVLVNFQGKQVALRRAVRLFLLIKDDTFLVPKVSLLIAFDDFATLRFWFLMLLQVESDGRGTWN